MIRPLLLLAVTAHCLLSPLPAAPQQTTPVASRHATEVRRFSAAEARQGIAADDDHLYVIDNRSIGKYEKETGRRVDGWSGAADGPIQHLNAGIVRDGVLHVASSNFPEVPMISSVELWDVATMEHIRSVPLGIRSGSLTWIDYHDGSWWAVFANYDNNGGVEGKGVEWTMLERFDEEWRRTGGWSFPVALIDRFRPYSSSGGFWTADDEIWLSGHDAAEVYVARLPAAGATLEWVATISAPIAGQGIARDPQDPSLLYGIDRAAREVIVARVE